jgi:phytoene dehydrogenase-like protein
MTQNIAIIGSGFLGMTLAMRLADAGYRVTLFEGADQIGGLASAWEIGDVVWDKHYHVTLAANWSRCRTRSSFFGFLPSDWSANSGWEQPFSSRRA